jgi:PIN domain nuclease of toxin-antitoxin system
LRLLLDTHVLIWWATDERLSQEARDAIASPRNHVSLSAVSVLETEIKRQSGKLKLGFDLKAEAEEQGFPELPMTSEHASAVGLLPLHHHDPFDRVLIAQALTEGLTLVTRDGMFDRYDVPLLKA